MNGPQIYIEGDNPYIHYIGNPYYDPGAKAIDSETGDVSGNITRTSNLNTNRLGEYFVRYESRDKYRNKSTVNPERKIKVLLNSQYLVGYYQFSQKFTDSSNTINNFDFITFINDTSFKLFNFTGIDSVYVNAYLHGEYKELITIPTQTITRNGINYEVSGTGNSNEYGNVLTIQFTQKELTTGSPITRSGTVTYKRFYF
jgi:hypothetical protein